MRGEARVQVERSHVGDWYPGNFVGLVVVGADGERLLGLGEHRRVGPPAVVVSEDATRAYRVWRHFAFLCRLPQGRRERRLMAVPRAAWQPPRAPVVAPPGRSEER